MTIFAAAFADQPDLDALSPAARRVLATSAALFFQDGAAHTSVRELTKACGLSPGALYNHFPSRDELLFTIVRHGHNRMRRRIDTALHDAGAAPVDGFRAYVGAYVAGHVDQPELAQLVRHEYLHLSPDHYAEIVAVRRATRRTLTGFIRAGASDGTFRLIGDAVGQTLMILDMCSRTSDWFDRSRHTDPAEIVNRYVEAALRLVGADSGQFGPQWSVATDHCRRN
ncbi:MAG TPA: TetR/AcrR family transcriptional regulator [Jatrophihabitans sp.]